MTLLFRVLGQTIPGLVPGVLLSLFLLFETIDGYCGSVLDTEKNAWVTAESLKLNPLCVSSVDSDILKCAELVRSKKDEISAPHERDAIALMYLQLVRNTRQMDGGIDDVTINKEAHDFLTEQLKFSENPEFIEMLLEALSFEEGNIWSAFAKNIERADRYPQSWDAQVSLLTLLENSITVAELKKLKLDVTRKAFNNAIDPFSKLDLALKYFRGLEALNREKDASSFRNEFISETANEKPLPIGSEDFENRGTGNWQTLADGLAIYCSEAYLVLFRIDTNCRVMLGYARTDKAPELDPSWFISAYNSLGKAGMLQPADRVHLKELTGKR